MNPVCTAVYSVQCTLYRVAVENKEYFMGTRIGYRIEARARLKGRYGTG